MYQAIKNYCEKHPGNGLFLMDMPTGFGKTYSVLKYIFEACQSEENKERKYFFITPLKKNLPYDELRKMFEEANKLTLYNEKVLFIDSTSDAVLNNFSKTINDQIPDEIKKTEEYKTFYHQVKLLQSQQQKNDYALREATQGIEKDFRDKTEPAFRRILTNMLAKKYSSIKQRIYAVKTDKAWQWIGVLYPTVFTQERQVFFLSMDKFLAKNTTIVEPSYQFYNHKIIDNAVVFIDEFDSTKETMLKNIIQNGLRDKIDYIELFRSIYSAMETNAFPTILTTPSEQRKKSEYASQTLTKILEDTHEKAREIYSQYSLQFTHRTNTADDDTYKNFLFQDHQFHSILNGKNSYVQSVSDESQRINSIRFTAEKPAHDTQNIQTMLGSLRGFIQWFQTTINILAINYRQQKNERKLDGEDEFTQEQAIRTVLSLFRLNAHESEYLTSQIMIASRKKRSNQIAGSEFDRSVYENGFRYYCFENDAFHDMQSQIMICSFQTTPEKLLLRFCERAKVIGISATATVPTVIGNFDLNYLRSRMQDAYYPLPDTERERFSKQFHESQHGYEKIQIHTELVGASGYSVQTWIDILEDQDLGVYVYDLLERKVLKNDSNNPYFNHERFARIAKVFRKYLLLNQHIQSMLCLLTKHPKSNDKVLDYETLIQVLDFVAKTVHPHLTAENFVVRLMGDEYGNTKDKIISALGSGKHLFVISTYQTLGAGQNLQYPIPDTLQGRLICSNDYPPRREKDFDAIYLDKPTNLVALTEDNWQEDAFVKYLFQMEFLQENAELSMQDTLKHIKKAFKCYMTGSKNLPECFAPSVYSLQSVRMYATRTVIQAIGRLCRTNQKREHIYIFADDRIADSLDLSVTKGRILNHEFCSLAEKIRGTQTKAPVSGTPENRANLTATKVNIYIQRFLRDSWNEKKIKDWNQLRQFVLQHPTASYEEAKGYFIIPNYYVELPQMSDHLYYRQEEDYSRVDVFFDKQPNTAIENAANARLDRLMKWSALQEHFIQNQYAVMFKPDRYIMSPPLWNNIYKGALGEAAGKFWFSYVMQIELEELSDPDEFELFDYRVRNLPVYVDFKNWDESTEMDWNETIEKIGAKAQKCGCKSVIIANLLTMEKYQIRKVRIQNIECLIVPSLLNDQTEIQVNEDAVHAIWRCLNDYTN